MSFRTFLIKVINRDAYCFYYISYLAYVVFYTYTVLNVRVPVYRDAPGCCLGQSLSDI